MTSNDSARLQQPPVAIDTPSETPQETTTAIESSTGITRSSKDSGNVEGPVLASTTTMPAANTTEQIQNTSDNADIGNHGSNSTAQQQSNQAITTTNTESTKINNGTSNSRTPYKYDPDKITLRFLFANRDGLTVTLTCDPSDTVGEVKGALVSIWPKDVPNCEDGSDLRLICMGKGFLSPDSRTLTDCQIPVFKTHPTPINVSVKPSKIDINAELANTNKKKSVSNSTTNTNVTLNAAGNNNNNNNQTTATSSSLTSRPASNSVAAIETGQGCCIIS